MILRFFYVVLVDFYVLQHVFVIFFEKYLHGSRKSSTFAPDFEKDIFPAVKRYKQRRGAT